jgi:hypothetical protein
MTIRDDVEDLRDTDLDEAELDRRLAATWATPERVVGGAFDRRSQDHRPSIYRHRLRVSGARWVAGDGDAAPAVPARSPVYRSRSLQPDLHHARHEHDVPVCRARDGGDGRLSRAADGWHPQHRLSAPQRLFLLDVSGRRAAVVDRFAVDTGPMSAGLPTCRCRDRNMPRESAPTSGRR